jgi:diacylglycerol kinase (ATP)
VVTNKKKLDADRRDALLRALRCGGLGDARWYEAKSGSKATPATEEALRDGADTVLAVGGDGTVRACAHALAGTGARLAVLPAGTANLFARSLDLPADPGAVVDLLTAGVTRTLDLGRCNDLRFAVMAGTGYDASLMRAVDDGPKERFGSLAYVWAGVREAGRQTPLPVRVEVDGRTFYRGGAVCVLVGNLGRLGAGVFAFPDASPTDGLLEVGVLTATTKRDWAGVAARVALRRPGSSPKVHMTRGVEIDVTWAPAGTKKQRSRAKRVPFELDGGVKGSKRRLHYICEPGALRVLVPATEEARR